MNYKTKDIVGVCLEVASIFVLSVAVKYDMQMYGSPAFGVMYTIGRNLRNEAQREKIINEIEDKSYSLERKVEIIDVTEDN